MFERILIVVNNSEVEKDTVIQGAVLAEQFHSAVRLVCVIDPPTPFSPVNYPYPVQYEEHVVAEARRELAALHSQFAADTPVEDVVLTGLPIPEFLAQAKEWGADLVIVGDDNNNHHSYARALFGSTTDALERRAPCPVLVVRRKENPLRFSADTGVACGDRG